MNSADAGGSFFERLKAGLAKTSRNLLGDIDGIISGRKIIDQALFEELEEVLIMADVGAVFTRDLIEKMKERVSRRELDRPEHLRSVLRDCMVEILEKNEGPPVVSVHCGAIHTIMVVGVNGTGKTTTIGKLAYLLKGEGRQVMLAAADTFRAAAAEQLDIWAQRTGALLIRQEAGADPTAVVFDALQAAKSGRASIVIVDTAGRLHTKVNLMEELKKMKRIMGRELPGSPDEVLLVLDATTGQNAISQARQFKDEIGITGLVLTKLDGTAKGGVVVRIAAELGIPIRYIGIGEKLDDLRKFNSREFVDAIFKVTPNRTDTD